MCSIEGSLLHSLLTYLNGIILKKLLSWRPKCSFESNIRHIPTQLSPGRLMAKVAYKIVCRAFIEFRILTVVSCGGHFEEGIYGKKLCVFVKGYNLPSCHQRILLQRVELHERLN